MAAPHSDVRDRYSMSWDQYWELDESIPGEYFDGQLVVSPNPDKMHQLACSKLWLALRSVLPAGYEVSEAWNWTPVSGVNFIPDVMVHPVTDDLVRFTGIPVLVVEVLSTNRTDDLILKRARYAAFGVARYWIVDRVAGTLQVLELAGTDYHQVAIIGAEPTEIDLGVARITLSVPELLTY